MTDLTYINNQGDTVFTSQFFKNRGSCCKSNCLHCPYGTTIRNCGLEVKEIASEALEQAQSILDKNQNTESATSSLLASAFGSATKTKIKIDETNISEYRLIYLKGFLCGVVKIGKFDVKDLYLSEYFQDQGINKELVQSFLD